MTYRVLRIMAAAALIAVPVAAPLASGQERVSGGTWTAATGEGPTVFYQEGDVMAMPGRAAFMGAEMAFDGEVVKSAPYSADATSETVHTLADGNRIVNTSKSHVYRDSEGRTRREQSLAAVGPWAAEGPHELVVINDPVSKTSVIIDPDKKTARKMLSPQVFVERVPGPEGKVRAEKAFTVAVAADASTGTVATEDIRGPRTIQVTVADAKSGKEESLGKRVIEGVECEGTRTTSTIAAGEIGNERAIDIVSERWFSPELKTVVLSTHSDPRFGETTFRLTNIERIEPDRSLFEMPAGVTIVDDGQPMRVQVRRQEVRKS